MSIVISCKTPEGVILGVDSAVTVLSSDRKTVLGVRKDQKKLFQLRNKPIGIAVSGEVDFGNKNVNFYLESFINDEILVWADKAKIADIVEELRIYFARQYIEKIIKPMEKEKNKKWYDIPLDEQPLFNMVIGGFSSKANAEQGEVWQFYCLYMGSKTPTFRWLLSKTLLRLGRRASSFARRPGRQSGVRQAQVAQVDNAVSLC